MHKLFTKCLSYSSGIVTISHCEAAAQNQNKCMLTYFNCWKME